MNRTHRVSLLGGDGIGPEVITAGMEVLDEAGRQFGFCIETTSFDWNSQRYLEHGSMMPSDGIATLAAFDAIYLGAVGSPEVPDHETLWGLLLPIRQRFDQYVNLRPVRLLEGVRCPLL